MKTLSNLSLIALLFVFTQFKTNAQENDTLQIHYLGHSSLMFVYQGQVIHVDPRAQEADYNKLPDADFVFVTHEHGDHYELSALNNVTKGPTILVTTETVKNKGNYSGTIEVMENGDKNIYGGIAVEAVPAYNFVRTNHPKGIGNGYVFTFGKTMVYVAGDTEDIPEMDSIVAQVAFLPMNQPYTMTEEQAANAALMVGPDVLYIYHNNGSDNNKLIDLLKDHPEIEVRIEESIYMIKTSTGETWKYEEENPVNLNKNQAINKVKIFPNPVNNKLYVNSLEEGSVLHILDLDGKVLKEVTSRANQEEINMKDLPTGNYILKVSLNNSEKTFGFIKI